VLLSELKSAYISHFIEQQLKNPRDKLWNKIQNACNEASEEGMDVWEIALALRAYADETRMVCEYSETVKANAAA
jgi:hypothetical protein